MRSADLGEGSKCLGATNWVGANKRSAEGSYMQLQVRYVALFRPEFDGIAAVSGRGFLLEAVIAF